MKNPINSAISWPVNGEHIRIDQNSPVVSLKGWATGDGNSGGKITKVEVSVDDGKTWKDAELTFQEKKDAAKNKVFSWTLWKYDIDVKHLKDNKNEISVTVRSYDSTGNKQDKNMDELYNLRGLLNNSPHNIKFTYSYS